MVHQHTQYFVWIKSANTVVPVSDESGKRYLEGNDGPNLQLLTRTITVSDFTDRNGNDVVLPSETNVKVSNVS